MMAYDEELDSRITGIVVDWGATTKKMFGGTCHLLNGNMLCGVNENRLIVRLGPEAGAAALEEPHAQPMDITGRPARSSPPCLPSETANDQEAPMNVMLLIGGVLSALIGIAHSVLGEKLVLGPLFSRGEVPKLIGSTTFARHTLRFTWHLTTVLLVGVGTVVVLLALTQVDAHATLILHVFAITFAVCSLLSLVGARARHFSWWVFLIIAVLLWLGA
jgi:hypothetical protein